MISIGVVNAKGGVGKTTLAVHLATRASKDFARVALVDTDPQAGAARWRDHRGGDPEASPVLLRGAETAADAHDRLVHSVWDVAIFDGGPGSLTEVEAVADLVDFVVIPLRAGDQDVASTEYAVAVCQKTGVDYLLVINDAEQPIKGNKDPRAMEVHELLRKLKQPVAKTIICRRRPINDAMTLGKSAAELKGGSVASSEIDDLYGEVITKAKAAAAKRAKSHGR